MDAMTLQKLWIDHDGTLTAIEADGYSMPLYSAVEVVPPGHCGD
jgi:hypothetical protein